MESEVCMYNKFGFCKYRSHCRRHHLQEECANHSIFKNVEKWDKRHPKACKKYNYENGCSRTDCAYKHTDSNKSVQADMIKEKMKIRENMLLEMSTKINTLENELREIRSKNSNEITTETFIRKEKQQESEPNVNKPEEQVREDSCWF